MKVGTPEQATWRGQVVPSAFVKYCRLFHQDVFVLHGTLEGAVAAYVAEYLNDEERREIGVYLQKLLSGKYDESDLKGLWNRMPSGIRVSCGVRKLLELTQEKIEAKQR